VISMKPSFRFGSIKALNFYPPLIGAGIYVDKVSDDMTSIEVVLKHRWWNQNIVGTCFGGSLYMMTDPFFMAILMANLGKDYIVWDRTADIQFLKPGRTDVRGHFNIPAAEIIAIRQKADSGEKVLPEFTVDIVDKEQTLIARVKKGLYVRKKPPKST
jgi:acyl-coenzyme A thioesterase PaaI-like protein